MKISETLLPELDRENAATRRLLERVPEGHNDWKPHPKSSSLGELAAHLAQIPSWLVSVFETDVLDGAVAGERFATPRAAATTRELLARFDASVASGRAALAAATDERVRATWTLKLGDKTLMAIPRTAAVRGFVLGHSIHHRGQLTVYLRMHDVPLPSIYGPTADESPS